MLLFAISIIVTICHFSHSFLLAQTYRLNNTNNGKPQVEAVVFEDIDEFGGRMDNGYRFLRACNLRTNLLKWREPTAEHPNGLPPRIGYLVAGNWKGTLPLEAIAFYSTETCAEDSLVIVIRFFGGEDMIEVVQLTGEYVPKDLVAWKSIPVHNTELEYPGAASILALSMKPGSVFIPAPKGEQTTLPIYCAGLIHELVWNHYNIAGTRARGYFSAQGLLTRVRNQLIGLEIPEDYEYGGEYDFSCTPLPQDELFLISDEGERDAGKYRLDEFEVESDIDIGRIVSEALKTLPRAEEGELIDFEDSDDDGLDFIRGPYKKMRLDVLGPGHVIKEKKVDPFGHITSDKPLPEKDIFGFNGEYVRTESDIRLDREFDQILQILAPGREILDLDFFQNLGRGFNLEQMPNLKNFFSDEEDDEGENQYST